MSLLSILLMVTIPSLAYSYGIYARIKAQQNQDNGLKLAFEEIQRLLREVIAAKDNDSLAISSLAVNLDQLTQNMGLLLQNNNSQTQALAYIVEVVKETRKA